VSSDSLTRVIEPRSAGGGKGKNAVNGGEGDRGLLAMNDLGVDW